MIKKLFLLACTLLLSLSASATESDTKKILFIGNSYTAGMRKMFVQLLKSEGNKSHVEFICPGGRRLIQHAANPKVLAKIKSRKWDYIILQEQSQTPAYPNLRPGFYEGARKLNKAIKAQGAKTIFYHTWGRRDGDKQNAHTAPDYETMQKLLDEGYTTIAKELKADTAPVGLIWRRLRLKNPKLGKEIYAQDGSHPSAKGAYLISLVFYQKIFAKKATEVKFKAKLTDAEAKLMKILVDAEVKTSAPAVVK